MQRSLKLTCPVRLDLQCPYRVSSSPGNESYVARIFKKPKQSVGYGGRSLAMGSEEQNSPHSAANQLGDLGHCRLDHFTISVHPWLLCTFAPETLLEELPLG